MLLEVEKELFFNLGFSRHVFQNTVLVNSCFIWAYKLFLPSNDALNFEYPVNRNLKEFRFSSKTWLKINTLKKASARNKADCINLLLDLPPPWLFSRAVWYLCWTGHYPSKTDSRPDDPCLQMGHFQVGKLHYWHLCIALDPVVRFKL